MRNSTEVASSNLTYDEVYSTQHYVINFVSDLRQIGRWFSPVSSINKTDHDITEILFKVALSTINLNPKPVRKSEDNFIANNKNKTFTRCYNIKFYPECG